MHNASTKSYFALEASSFAITTLSSLVQNMYLVFGIRDSAVFIAVQIISFLLTTWVNLREGGGTFWILVNNLRIYATQSIIIYKLEEKKSSD